MYSVPLLHIHSFIIFLYFSSRASSRPGSIYGYKSLNAFNAAAAARGSKESTPDSPKRSPKRKTDSIGSELSVDSVNSILSDEGSCKTYSSLSTARRSRGKPNLNLIIKVAELLGYTVNIYRKVIGIV